MPRHLHVSPIQGLLFSTYSLAQVIALPLLGRWSDHIGRRPVYLCFGTADVREGMNHG